MTDEQSREELAREVEQLRSERAASLAQTRDESAALVESDRQGRAHELAQTVDDVAINAAKDRQELAARVAYAAGAEAARIDTRLEHLDDAVERINGSIGKTGDSLDTLRREMQARFQAQTDFAEATKADSRKLLLQIFGTVMAATIAAAATIVVALISSGPA